MAPSWAASSRSRREKRLNAARARRVKEHEATYPMHFTVNYKRPPFGAQGAADVTFLVEADTSEAAEAAAEELYLQAYGRTPADDHAELVSVRLSDDPA
jgi:hypothetical protein